MDDEPLNLEQIESSIRNHEKILESSSNNYNFWHMRGHLLCQLKRYEEAIGSYDKAIEINPNYSVSWYERGLALIEIGRFETAVYSYDEFCKLEPDNYKGWMEQGRVFHRLRRNGNARLNFNKATQLRPDLAVCWYWYGIAIAATGYPEEALLALDRGLEIQPTSPYTLAARGNVLRKLGQKESAMDSYNAAIEQNRRLLEETTRKSLYQEYQPLHHRSNLSLDLLLNPMHKLNPLDFKLIDEIDHRTKGQAWFYSLGLDFYIFGDPESLDSKHLDDAEDVLAQLEELEAESIGYIEGFLDRTHIGAYGDSSLIAVLCNFVAARLELQMNFEHDPYGLWFVEFHRQVSGVWSPFSFGRSNW